MEERDWLILKALYKQKNITKAAKDLFISQPALTNRLQQIENEFKVKIVNRGHRGVHFTPEGEYLANCADEMLLRIRSIKESVLSLDARVKGTLRIGASKFVTKYKLPRILRLFKDKYPDVDFKVTTGWSGDVYNFTGNGDVHVGFVREEHSWPGQKLLLAEENVCIASKFAIDLKNLPNLPRINYQTDYLFRALVDNWWTCNYTLPPSISMEVDQVDTCKEMIINGLGYAILSSMVLDGVENLHRINIQTPDGQPITRRTWMIYQAESLEVNMVNAFVNFVADLDFAKSNSGKIE